VITHAPIGSKVHDKAAVSGALGVPTGTVDFTVYTGNTQCQGDGVAAGSVALVNGIAHPSGEATVPVGGLSYQARYKGDDTYKESLGPCEPLGGDKLDSSTKTDIHNAAHEVITEAPLGATVHDQATVSGPLTTPTGMVDFKFYADNRQCEGEGSPAGSVALAGGVAHPSESAAVGMNGLSFRAHYNGNDTYNPSTGPCEPLMALKPPPLPAPPLIDLAVTKVDKPDPAKLNGNITYTMVVTNNGPDTATQVTVADPLPAGTSFVSVSTTQGTCTNSNGLIQCSLGTLPKSASVTITLVVKATRAGVVTNEVTVVGKEPESNTANNRASATTLVPTPLVPPKKPKPVCSTLTVGPKSLRVGKRSTIAATVKNRGKAVKGAKVRVRGAGILKSGRTNARGKAHITVRPVRPGIVVVSVPQKLVCGSKRIGVVGVFEPPVTG
jgi:uncharacterized repeat protein (TIGR01451 family)